LYSVRQASISLLASFRSANQVFKWRRAFERGELVDSAASSTALLPVTIGAPSERVESGAQQQPAMFGSIHIEFPGRAMIRVESGADPALLRSILESLRK
jgi:transposase